MVVVLICGAKVLGPVVFDTFRTLEEADIRIAEFRKETDGTYFDSYRFEVYEGATAEHFLKMYGEAS